MSKTSSSKDSDESSIFNQPWATMWRKAIVSLPRLVPDVALRLTSPEGPQPVVIEIPSRGKYKIPLYVFIPPEISTKNVNDKNEISCPVLLDFHGGSFVFGSCQEQAPFCAKLCRELNCIAISVDYRLGPASKFPAAFEDAEDVLNAVLHTSRPGHKELRQAINSNLIRHCHHHQQSSSSSPSTSSHHSSHNNNSKKHAAITMPTITLDTTRIALSGFSSGGNLAMNLALSINRHPAHIDTPWPSPFDSSPVTTAVPLLLFYPALDTRLLPHERPRPTGLAEPKGFLTSLRLEAELMPTYLPRHMATHPRASPCLVALSPTGHNADGASASASSSSVCTGTFHPLARSYLVLPEHDAITAQSETWVKMVLEEGRGADLTVVRVPGVVHGWTQFPDPWLDPDARSKKNECFDGAVAFARDLWTRAGDK